MYPVLRFWRAMANAKKQPPLSPFEPHISQHICWPWDIDPWRELNNGRTLTIYDLGRVPLALRTGMGKLPPAEGYRMAIAGSFVRYRMRVTAFQRLTMVSRMVGWDARFFYYEQTMWRGQDCTSQLVVRAAATKTGVKGIQAPAQLAALIWPGVESPALPDWITAWVEAETLRPWPPEAQSLLPR